MNQYKDTTERIKRPQRVKKGQNAPIFFTFLMDVTKCGGIFAGLVATIGYLSQCHTMPANAKSTRGVFTTPQTMLENIKTTQPNKNSLPLVAGVNNNNATTKRKAVKPSRHPLAIFVPKIHRATNSMDTTGTKPPILWVSHIYKLTQHGEVVSYGGLIRPNTRPVTGNKSSRLFAVVETRPPFQGVGITSTERKGGHNHA